MYKSTYTLSAAIGVTYLLYMTEQFLFVAAKPLRAR